MSYRTDKHVGFGFWILDFLGLGKLGVVACLRGVRYSIFWGREGGEGGGWLVVC